MLNTNISVIGYYNKSNVGDQLFIEAFKKIFPKLTFCFYDEVTEESLKAAAIFFGGGSFLFSDKFIKPEFVNRLKLKPFFYIGVGAETDIHPVHIELMSIAKLIAIRTPEHFNKIKTLNANTILIKDLVYSLGNSITYNKIKKSLLIIPNAEVIPHVGSAHWMYASWEFFKSEVCQALDVLKQESWQIDFLPMCINDNINDTWVAHSLVSNMSNRYKNYLLPHISSYESIVKTISKYNVIISQRFHGNVLAELCKIPYISMYHHDKLKKDSFYGAEYISYYKANKQELLNAVFNLQNKTYNIDIEEEKFKDLRDKVYNLL